MLSRTLHFYSHWAKQRTGEMDAAIAFLQRHAKRLHAGPGNSRLITGLKRRRDRLKIMASKQATKSDAAWKRSKKKMDLEWKAFEAELFTFVKNAKKRSGLQKSAFSRLAGAQAKAWKDAERSLRVLARKIAPIRRSRVSAAIKQISREASASRKRAAKLGRSAAFTWSAMRSALNTSRKAFDKANHRAARSIRKALR
jgi:hypothetical protein